MTPMRDASFINGARTWMRGVRVVTCLLHPTAEHLEQTDCIAPVKTGARIAN